MKAIAFIALAALGLAGCATTFPLSVQRDRLDKITPGTSRQEDVTEVMGAPTRVRFDNKGRQVEWDYEYVDLWTYRSELALGFNADGVVVSKFAARLDDH